MTVPKLACLEPIKLALKSALTKFNIGRCLPAWKKRAYGDAAKEMFTALEAAPSSFPAYEMIRLGPVCHRVLPGFVVTGFCHRVYWVLPCGIGWSRGQLGLL